MGFKKLLVGALARVVGRRGYSLVETWRFEELAQREAMRKTFTERLSFLLAGLGVACVLDVGANRGQFRDLLRDEAAYAGEVVSFEPIPDLADDLEERARRDSKWEVRPVALGDQEGLAPFHVMSMDVFSSLHAPLASQPQTFRRSNAVERVIEVPVRTLAGEIRRLEQRGHHSFYLKLDTQGHDLAVLRGAGDALSRVLALQSEVSLVPLYEGMPDWLTALAEFRRLGFEPAYLDPVSVDMDTGRLVELDCILVRSGTRLAASDPPPTRT